MTLVISPLLLCRDCGEPHGGDGRRRYCFNCAAKRDCPSKVRWRWSAHGRRLQRRNKRTPEQKIREALWAEANVEKVRAAKHAYEVRTSTAGHIIRCQTGIDTDVRCDGTWIRTRYNGRRQFCDECRGLHESYADVRRYAVAHSAAA